MRTTLNIDEILLEKAKHLAVERGVPLVRVIEDALKESLLKKASISKKVELVTFKGKGTKPGIDLDDGRSLLEIMDN